MRYLTATSTLEDLTGSYGVDWKAGVLSEHLHLAEANTDLQVRTLPSGRTWVAPARGGKAVPVVCSEIIAIPTEDEVVSGRCGLPVGAEGVCEVHFYDDLDESERLYLAHLEDAAAV